MSGGIQVLGASSWVVFIMSDCGRAKVVVEGRAERAREHTIRCLHRRETGQRATSRRRGCAQSTVKDFSRLVAGRAGTGTDTFVSFGCNYGTPAKPELNRAHQTGFCDD